MDRYTGRTVVITGGGSGIGKATALRVASEGANVVVVDMNLEAAEAVAAEVKGAKIGFTCNFGGFGNNVVCLIFARE